MNDAVKAKLGMVPNIVRRLPHVPADAQIVEVLAQVAFNTLANCLNHGAATDIDSPFVKV